jgi:hypothetical protein
MSDLSGEIASKNQLRVDHMRDVSVPYQINPKSMVHNDVSMFLQLLDLPELPQDLDVGQKRAIICRELERRKRDARDVAHSLLRMKFSLNGYTSFHLL